jgi:hypothetical protein
MGPAAAGSDAAHLLDGLVEQSDMATEAAVSPDPPVITLALRVLELAPRTIRRMRRRVRTRRLRQAA